MGNNVASTLDVGTKLYYLILVAGAWKQSAAVDAQRPTVEAYDAAVGRRRTRHRVRAQ